MGITCQMCGTDNGDKQKFCSSCGTPLAAPKTDAQKSSDGKAKTIILGGAAAAPAPAETPAAPSKNKAHTMILGSTAKPAPTSAPKKKVSPGGEKTMLGMPAVTAEQATAMTKDKKNIPIVKVSSPPGPKHIVGSKTDLGISSPQVQESPPPKVHKTSSKTVMGMPAVDFDTSSGGPKQKVLSDKKKTADKKAANKSDDPSRAATEAVAAVSDPIDDTEGGTPSPFADEIDSDYDSSSDEWPVDDMDDEEDEQHRSNGLLIAVIAAGIVAIVVVGTLLYLLIFDAVPPIRPQIFPSPDGKSLMVALALPEAPPGTQVQVAGQTVPVNSGTAKATLPLSQMKLGLNDIVLIYSEPGETPEKLSFPIVLRHTIKDDLSGLAADPPFVSVLFQIAPEVRLTVAGTPINAAGGSYTHKIPVANLPVQENPDSHFLMHKVPFQLIDAAGGVEQGEHVVAIPLSKLQIDRPAPNAMVASESITCAGVSETGASIKINGQLIPVSAVGFNSTLPLDSLGEHTLTITAKAPNKAPRTQTMKITRVESMTPVIDEWSKDLDPKLDYPTIGRNPAVHIDKKVMLNGRVVNINTVKGVTAFILYVGEGCPPKSKCAVYVVFKGETEAGLQSWVDVYGTVQGTHAVDMQNGVKIEVPAVDAEFVIKSDPKKRGRKR